MPLTKDQKKEVIEKVSHAIKGQGSIVFSDFKGLTVAETLELRRALRKDGVGYLVAKKTLANKALSGAGFSGTIPELPGQLGIAYGADSIAPARGVYTFQKKFDGKIVISGGVFEGKYISKEEMTKIASIPSREILLAQFVQLINSPRQRFAVVLGEKAKKTQ